MFAPAPLALLGAALLAALLMPSSQALAGDVLTVGPAGTYAQIQDAIDAASDGDIVLVESGTYGGVVIVNKTLTVLAERDALVEVDGIRVEQLASQRSVALIGLVSVLNFSPDPELVLVGNAGSVRVEGCTIRKYGQIRLATVDQCADVSFRDCEIGYFSPPGFYWIMGHDALTVTASRVSLSGGSVVGGKGPLSETIVPWPAPHPGYAALRVVDSEVFVSGTRIEGGHGAPAYCDPIYAFLNQPAGDGGPAVQLEGTQSLFRHRAATIVAGAGGDGGFCGIVSHPGVAFDDPLGAAFPIGGLERPLDAPRAPREDEAFTFTLHGLQGEAAFVLFSSGLTHAWLPATQSMLFVEAPFVLKFLGYVGPSNALTLVTSIPELGPGIDGMVVQVQPLFLGPQSNLQLGELHTMVPVDRGF